VRTPSMTYEWNDNNGVKQPTAWSKKVRKAMVRGGAEYQVQEAMNHAVIISGHLGGPLTLTLLGAPVDIGALLKPGSRSLGRLL